jgi:hypothetical protein
VTFAPWIPWPAAEAVELPDSVALTAAVLLVAFPPAANGAGVVAFVIAVPFCPFQLIGAPNVYGVVSTAILSLPIGGIAFDGFL